MVAKRCRCNATFVADETGWYTTDDGHQVTHCPKCGIPLIALFGVAFVQVAPSRRYTIATNTTITIGLTLERARAEIRRLRRHGLEIHGATATLAELAQEEQDNGQTH